MVKMKVKVKVKVKELQLGSAAWRQLCSHLRIQPGTISVKN